MDVVVLKKNFLRLLKEDEEFRYAVAGLIGLDEILKKLDKHEEELKKFREDFLVFVKEQEKKWEENRRLWEENFRRWEENNKRWEENNRRWEENAKRWEEAYKRFEAIDKRLEVIEARLEHHSKVLEEHAAILKEHTKILMEHSNVIKELVKRVSRLELAVGALTEASFARYVYDDLYVEASSKGEKILRRVRNYRFNETDIDLFIETDKSIYIVEVKVKPRHEDVGLLIAKVDLVKAKYPGKNVVGILATTMIGREVEEYAIEKGIQVYKY
uniref:DUF3782 domain-containing protein n=1 Tax=Ignisphaera aggregans TaxID=334771 RepID=A0A7C4JK71_9CREN